MSWRQHERSPVSSQERPLRPPGAAQSGSLTESPIAQASRVGRSPLSARSRLGIEVFVERRIKSGRRERIERPDRARLYRRHRARRALRLACRTALTTPPPAIGSILTSCSSILVRASLPAASPDTMPCSWAGPPPSNYGLQDVEKSAHALLSLALASAAKKRRPPGLHDAPHETAAARASHTARPRGRRRGKSAGNSPSVPSVLW